MQLLAKLIKSFSILSAPSPLINTLNPNQSLSLRMQQELAFVMKLAVKHEAFNEHVNNSQVPKGKQRWQELFLPAASSWGTYTGVW